MKRVRENPILNEDPSSTNAEELENKIHKLIKETSDNTIPKKSQFPRSVPWWNKGLTKQRKEVRRIKRKYLTEKNEAHRALLKVRYTQLRNQYTTSIRKSKLESWKKFVTIEGNKNPWGFVYKLQANKLRVEKVQESIKHTDTQTTSWQETANIILDTLILDDNIADETTLHKAIRRDTQTPPDTEDTEPFLIKEIEKVINNLKCKKAPGHDLIEAEIIKRSCPILRQEITQLMNNCLSQGIFPSNWKRGELEATYEQTLQSEKKTIPDSAGADLYEQHVRMVAAVNILQLQTLT